jgi:uncharacterized protein
VVDEHYDDYDVFMEAGVGRRARARRHGLEQLRLLAQDTRAPEATTPSGATRRWTAFLHAQPLKVPVMLVHSLWDQEDIYGAPAVYKALKPKDVRTTTRCSSCWAHGTTARRWGDGSSLGAFKFGSDTALYFRRRFCGRSWTSI